MNQSRMKLLVMRLVSALFVTYFRVRHAGSINWGRGIIMNNRFRFSGPGRLVIGDNCNLWAHQEPNSFYTYASDAVIKVGNNCRLNGVEVHCRKAITFGDDCLAGSAILMDNDFHATDFAHRNDRAHIKTKPVIIEDRAWLGGQSAILKGVTVGKEAVVAFRAVVTKDAPEGSVVAGNPAAIVR